MRIAREIARTPQLSPTSALIPEAAVLDMVPVSRSTWRRLYERGEAPRPVKVGARRLWSLAEVERFVQRLLADRGRGASATGASEER